MEYISHQFTEFSDLLCDVSLIIQKSCLYLTVAGHVCFESGMKQYHNELERLDHLLFAPGELKIVFQKSYFLLLSVSFVFHKIFFIV